MDGSSLMASGSYLRKSVIGEAQLVPSSRLCFMVVACHCGAMVHVHDVNLQQCSGNFAPAK
jgi:hypothetical protein